MGGIRNFFLLIRKFWENVLRVTKLKDRSQGDNYGSCFCPNEDLTQGNDKGLTECDML